MKSKFVLRFLIILICYTSLFNWNVMGAPFGSSSKIDPTSKRKPDIIAGEDFLSLFMAAASSAAKNINELESASTIRITSKSTTSDSFEDDVITVTTIYEGDIANTSITTQNDEIITTSAQTIHKDEKNDLITEESEQQQTIIRDSRSSNIYSYGYKNRNVEEYEDNEHPYYPPLPESEEIAINTSAPAQVLSIRVSSSVGKSPSPTTQFRIETSTRSLYDNYQQRPSSETPNNVVLSEQENVETRNAASAGKSILNIDEMEPMTFDNSNPIKELHNTFKETQRQIGANPDYLEQQRYKQIQKLHPVQHHHPYHHSVVFHGQSKEGTRARSVSYSSVIQNIHPAAAERNWEQAESIERPTYLQNSHNVLNKDFESLKISSTSSPTSNYPQWGRLVKEVKNLEKVDSTSVLPIVYQQPEVQWGQPERNQERQTTKFENSPTSSPNYQQQEVQWGQPEVNYEESYNPTPTPKYIPPPVYATEEQNYEVDEAVSVMTNGRTHGIQERPPQPVIPLQQGQQQTSDSQSQQQGNDQQSGVPSGDKTDNNHKVGYVVEGRNFRKYRVEERTSDGFVVGEYGVVNHDDGSLRGVRYTADGTINPRLIYDALMKFLSL